MCHTGAGQQFYTLLAAKNNFLENTPLYETIAENSTSTTTVPYDFHPTSAKEEVTIAQIAQKVGQQ